MNIQKGSQSCIAKKFESSACDAQALPRILLAEDCPVTALSAKEMLHTYGYDVTVVGDGSDALKALAEGAYDFVLIDMEMPVMDGFETCRRLRSGYENAGCASIPVIGMSAHSSALLRKVGLKIGMLDILEKPLDYDLLIGVLQSLESKKHDVAASWQERENKAGQMPVLARKAALERLAGAESLYESLLQKLRDVLPERQSALATSVAQQEYASIELTAHSLAGSLGAVGAQRCMYAAKQLCEAARAQDAGRVLSCYQTFTCALDELFSRLKPNNNK